MTEPIDPHATPQYPPPAEYTPPPPFAPQPYGGYPPPAQPGHLWTMTSDGVLVPVPIIAPERRHTRRNVLIVLLVAALVAAAGIVTYLLVSGGSSPNRLAIPPSFAGYHRLTNDSADRIERLVRSIGSSQGGEVTAVFDQAAIGVYGLGSSELPSFVYLALRTSAVPNRPADPGTRVAFMLEGALTPGQATPFPPGANGGVLECGSPQFGAVSETMCGWSDSRTTGLTLAVNPAQRPADLAQLTNELRAILDR